jgi:hypothetical protein
MPWVIPVFLGVVIGLDESLVKIVIYFIFFPSLGVPKGFRFSLNFLFKTE